MPEPWVCLQLPYEGEPMNKHNIWHAAYARWYDHDKAGHRVRAAIWGWVADRACDILWPTK